MPIIFSGNTLSFYNFLLVFSFGKMIRKSENESWSTGWIQNGIDRPWELIAFIIILTWMKYDIKKPDMDYMFCTDVKINSNQRQSQKVGVT